MQVLIRYLIQFKQVVDYGEIDFYVLGPNGHLVQRIEKNSTGSILLQRKQFEKDFSKYGGKIYIIFP